MEIRRIFLFTILLSFVAAASSLAAGGFPEYVDNDDAMRKKVESVAGNEKVKALVADLGSQANADARFDTFLELVRIAAPSREEMHRAQAVAKMFQSYIDKYQKTSDAAKNAKVIYNFDGKLDGAGVQMVDGLPVYNVCMEIKGTYAGKGYQNPAGKDIRPKVLFEGHIDSVNPGHLDGYPNIKNTIMPIHLQNINEKVVNTTDALAALPQLKFTKDGKPDKADPNYIVAKKRYTTQEEAKKANALRLYVPSIGDMMLQTVNLIQTAEFILKNDVRPVYDIWVCGTAGEEGRGNLDGMKQLFGYSQDGMTQADGSVKYRGEGNNALNFVANVSTEGGVTIHYLGSHRYQVAYTGVGGPSTDGNKVPNPLVAASVAVACVSDLKTPAESDPVKTKFADLKGDNTKTTYTVGLVYADTNKPFAKGAIPTDVSIEVDMRSNNPVNVEIMDRQMQACFEKGLQTANSSFKLPAGDNKLVKKEIRWYGDRPAYVLNADEMKTSPMLKAISYSNAIAYKGTPDEKLKLTDPSKASSVNSNVPAKLKIPTVNINYGVTAAKGQGHGFNEWGILGDAKSDAAIMSRAIYTLFTIAGLEEAGVKPTYQPLGPRDTDVIFP